MQLLCQLIQLDDRHKWQRQTQLVQVTGLPMVQNTLPDGMMLGGCAGAQPWPCKHQHSHNCSQCPQKCAWYKDMFVLWDGTTHGSQYFCDQNLDTDISHWTTDRASTCNHVRLTGLRLSIKNFNKEGECIMCFTNYRAVLEQCILGPY